MGYQWAGFKPPIGMLSQVHRPTIAARVSPAFDAEWPSATLAVASQLLSRAENRLPRRTGHVRLRPGLCQMAPSARQYTHVIHPTEHEL